ncbi:DNA polymerase III subunit alpha [Embleya scabrispora]|uniref:DNA polymerase III subunit alpha n=1 Tax=Embleya scabrispora TaxID=159449 RepID=UPI00036CA74C|nr:DNA polymerase III subunit alpha [Embleya scabrispora]MYS86581.1 DNA polymerase III subunit alpha [Streptomyces sp. SID5474]
MDGFAHLHVASGYSARYGTSHPENLVARAAERGMTTLALTDRDTVGGAVRFAQACTAHGVRPIFGVDLAVAPAAPGTPRAQRRRTPVRGGAHVEQPPLRVTLLARNAAGWARLCRLVSAAHAVEGPPVVPWSALREHAGPGLTVLLGPTSEPVRALSDGRLDTAEHLLAPWRELFGDALRLECLYYGSSGTGPGSLRLAARTGHLADRVGVAAVLTNAVRYADPDQHKIADVLDAARLLRPIRFHRPDFLDPRERWLKDPLAMAATAARIADAAGAGPDRARTLLARTAATADECRVDPVADLGLGGMFFPEPAVVGATAESAARVLRERCQAGMVRRGLDRDEAAMERLARELEVIGRLRVDTYFLTVGQVVADVREMGVRVAARGSGAGSMVCHALDIATANPLDHGLLFERFLSERRSSLPDVDIDVESARRLDVYRRIFERFGSERVAVTSMPETYRARHALRDVGLALGLAAPDIDRIAKSFPHIRARGITTALAELPELRSLAAEAGRYGPLFELAEKLDALPRGMAMHPCGVIITDATLLDRLPVQPTPGDAFPMVQAAKEEVEALGLIKLDVLGVRMQSAMTHAVAEVERTTGEHIDLDDPRQVPLDDFFAFKLIQTSDTIGMFQLESPGQQDLLSRLQPRGVQDVIADISLFRPGPVAGGMPERYIAARHGAAPTYPHPDLEPVLADTYGVTIWHEQIMGLLSVMTGCDLALADVARRALGDRDRLPSLRTWFHQRAATRGYSPEVREEVWRIVESFGAYGFCRAHAVAFAVPALQSAWLKAHHPAALYAGLLEHDPGMWPRRVIVADARRHRVPILPVDVNHSHPGHTVEQTGDGTWGVRLALSAVRGITDEECARIDAGRPYTSLSDLWQRARPALPTAEHLARIGALDGLHNGRLTRRDLLLQLPELHRRTRRVGDGQLPLADSRLDATAPSGLPEMTTREAVGAELHVLGIDLSRHLMEHHHRLLREIGAVDAAHLAEQPPGRQVLVAGVRASTQTPPIASGKRVIFVTLDDGSGLVDLAFFEDSHPACAHTVFHSGLLLVRGKIQVRGRRRTVVGTMAWDLDEIATLRRDHGPQAALDLLGAPTAHPTPAQPRRILVHGTGALQHPYADLQPPGQRSADLTRYGHRSPGSPG